MNINIQNTCMKLDTCWPSIMGVFVGLLIMLYYYADYHGCIHLRVYGSVYLRVYGRVYVHVYGRVYVRVYGRVYVRVYGRV